MLCINVDISAYTQISELALKLGGIVPNHAEQASEIFVDGVSNSVNQVLTELYGEKILESKDFRIFTICQRASCQIRAGTVNPVFSSPAHALSSTAPRSVPLLLLS